MVKTILKYEIIFKNYITCDKNIFDIVKESKNIVYLKNSFNELKVYKKSYRVFVKENSIYRETAKANIIKKIS